jgi:hypothetical protein
MTTNQQHMRFASSTARAWLHDEYVDKVNAAVARGDDDIADELAADFALDDADELASARFGDAVDRLIQLVRA